MKIIIGVLTYPRDYSDKTYNSLKRTFDSLVKNVDLRSHTIKVLVIGDDYNNIEELSPIFEGYDASFFNINVNDALRNKDIPGDIIWFYACVRSVQTLFEKALAMADSYDYLLLSSDDDEYINNKLTTSIGYIHKYGYPDLVYSLGIYRKGRIMPHTYNKKALELNYPLPENVIAAGMLYNLKNRKFIEDNIQFRAQQYQKLLQYIQTGNFKQIGPDHLFPEDAQLWHYLQPQFKSKKYRSLLIPEVLVNHDTEKTVLNYIAHKN
jgi:hypothetical protein